MPYCIQCGKEVVENARFCYHCGASVPTTDVAAAPVLKTDPPAPNMQEAKTSGKRNAPWRTVGWICLAVITTMFFINLICSMAIGVGLLPNESRAKQFAEQEVEEAWQDFDEDLDSNLFPLTPFWWMNGMMPRLPLISQRSAAAVSPM